MGDISDNLCLTVSGTRITHSITPKWDPLLSGKDLLFSERAVAVKRMLKFGGEELM